MCPAKAGQSGAVGTKSGPSGPSEDLRGPQKGHFGPKRSLLGPLGAQKGLDTRSKCVVSMTPTQTGQSGAVGTKSGPPGPSEVPERTFYGQNGPFLPLFDRFLKLGGSIWTITMLDEQSIPIRFSGHPTSLYFEKKIPTQNWPVEI